MGTAPELLVLGGLAVGILAGVEPRASWQGSRIEQQTAVSVSVAARGPASGATAIAGRQYLEFHDVAKGFMKATNPQRTRWNNENKLKYWVAGTGTVSDLSQTFEGVADGRGGVTTVIRYLVKVRVEKNLEAKLSYLPTDANRKTLERLRKGQRFEFQGRLDGFETIGRKVAGSIIVE